MSSLAAAFPLVPRFLGAFAKRPAPGCEACGVADDSAEDARNRRAVIHEMLSRNPDAFRGDVDIQAMMQMYPGSF